MSRHAVFWDRDNTLIRDPGYISSPEQVEPLPGSAEAIRKLAAAGFENIVVTNQSGVARGKFDEPTLERIHDRMVALFAERGAKIDAVYYCPYLPGDEAVVEQYRQDSELRKPKPGMILQAALERRIDLAGSWMIGDSPHDAQAGRAAGCRTILIRKPGSAEPPRKGGEVDFVADSLEEAAGIVLKYTRLNNTQNASAPDSVTAAGPPEDSTAVLRDILAFLRNVDRRRRAEEFSLASLLGTLAQILTVGALVWALFGWFRAERLDALLRLQFATILQLIALTCFSLSSRR